MKNSFISKTDIAQAYFPLISASSARHKLMQILQDDANLILKLLQTGYNPKSHYFTPIQIDLIIATLGDPWRR